jgi:nucleotide-binding universal stress UspA family protein
MALATVLLHLAEWPRNRVNAILAAELAKAQRGRVSAIYTLPPIAIPAYVAEYIPPDVIATQEKQATEAALEAKGLVEEICRSRNVEMDWRLATGDAIHAAIAAAHFADVVVIGQPDPDEDFVPEVAQLPFDLVLGAGRPVLVAPYVGEFRPIGKQVLVAWNASRESSRAVADALPILQSAQRVRLLAIAAAEGEGDTLDQLAAYLGRHGVKTESNRAVASGIEAGDVLLDAVSDFGADLLVMGAWGHSRLRERLLGGVTRTILQQMTVPVLMSH